MVSPPSPATLDFIGPVCSEGVVRLGVHLLVGEHAVAWQRFLSGTTDAHDGLGLRPWLRGGDGHGGWSGSLRLRHGGGGGHGLSRGLAQSCALTGHQRAVLAAVNLGSDEGENFHVDTFAWRERGVGHIGEHAVDGGELRRGREDFYVQHLHEQEEYASGRGIAHAHFRPWAARAAEVGEHGGDAGGGGCGECGCVHGCKLSLNVG